MSSPSRSRHRRIRSVQLAVIGAVIAATSVLAPLAGAVTQPPTAPAVTQPPTAPVVKTEGATVVTQTSATITATVDPSGASTVYFFQYGKTGGYGSQTGLENLAAGTAPVGVNAPISGLTPKTRYHFRIEATNALGTTHGADSTFTTATPPPPPPAPKPPVVKTGAASPLSPQSEKLAGTVNPSNQPTTYFFQYGTTSAYGSQSPPATLTAANAADPVSGAIVGLAAATKYHYRLVAANAGGKTTGSDATFTTRPVALSLTLGATPNPVTFGTPLSLPGTITGTGAPGRAIALQANPYPYTTGFQNVGNPLVISKTGAFQFNLPALATTTQFRAVGVGSPAIISPTLTEHVALAVTLNTTVSRTRTRAYHFNFTGTISPAQGGARVSLQRLVAGRWRRVKLTTAQPAATGSSSYTITQRRRHGGFFRIHVTPIDRSHTAGLSGAQLVHAHATG